MNQRDHWEVVRRGMEIAKCHALRIEDQRAVGVPDVNFANGWIELKQVTRGERSMKRVDDEFSIGETPAQRHWWLRRKKADGAVFVSVAVNDEFYLFDAGIFCAAVQNDEFMVTLRRLRYYNLLADYGAAKEKPHTLYAWFFEECFADNRDKFCSVDLFDALPFHVRDTDEREGHNKAADNLSLWVQKNEWKTW